MQKSIKEWKEELKSELEYAIKRLEEVNSKEEAEEYEDFFASNVSCFMADIEDLVQS